jgi:hypothetical protein
MTWTMFFVESEKQESIQGITEVILKLILLCLKTEKLFVIIKF